MYLTVEETRNGRTQGSPLQSENGRQQCVFQCRGKPRVCPVGTIAIPLEGNSNSFRGEPLIFIVLKSFSALHHPVDSPIEESRVLFY
jgi:hypothetical protein